MVELGLHELRAGERRFGQVVACEALAVRPGLGERQERPLLLLVVLVAQALLHDPVLVVEVAPPARIEQVRDDADDA